MIVADTNLIAYFFHEGKESEIAAKVFLKDNRWTAPLLWRSEFLNVLMKKLRFESASYDEMKGILSDALMLMQGSEIEPNPHDVLELVSQSNLSSYDCEFIATAKKLNLRVVTSDRKMLAAFPTIAISPSDFIGQ